MSLSKTSNYKFFVVHGITGYEEREKLLNELLGHQYNLDFEFVTESLDNDENEDLKNIL